jgi:hypothetical protein
MDYLNQGDLNSITIIDHGCFTSICEEEDWEITITSRDQMKDIESVFFNKIQNIFHYTQEDGPMYFIFHYDKKDIEFHASLACDYSGGVIYYTDRQIKYNFQKSDMRIFKKLYTTSCQ